MALPKAYSHHGYIQLPPDSTGKTMGTVTHVHLNYTSGVKAFVPKDIVVGSSSGASAMIYDVDGSVQGGTLNVMMEPLSIPYDFTVGENLLVDGTICAVVESTYIFHNQSVCVSGANNPHYGLRIGPKGAAYVRFADGEQQLDAFGLSRQSTPTQMAQYMFPYNIMPNDFLDETNGTAQLTYIQDESSVALDVGSASGDHISRTSHRYHLYQAGYPTLTEMTVTVGDNGKTNVRRRWGYFDETDGAFFELDGTNVYVVLRSSTDGTPSDTRVAQDEWNGDQVDGQMGDSNLSGMTLDFATINLYWIDVQWLGAGKVRYGIYDTAGMRIVLHTFYNGNSNPGPYMSQANLPVRIEQTNTGVTASPSRIKLTCVTVKVEGQLVEARSRKTKKWTADSGIKTVDSTNDYPICSFRSTLILNGRPNRKTSIPELISVHVVDNPIVLQVSTDSTIQDGTFNYITNTAAEMDTDATAMTGGNKILSWCLSAGDHNLDLPQNFGLFSQNMIVNADGNYGITYTFSAQSLADGTAQVRLFTTWIDVM